MGKNKYEEGNTGNDISYRTLPSFLLRLCFCSKKAQHQQRIYLTGNDAIKDVFYNRVFISFSKSNG